MPINKSSIEIAVEIFKEKRCELSFNELFNLVMDRKEYPQSLREEKLVHFYTNLSSDGRFVFDKTSKKWGLISLLDPEVVKENKTGFDDSDDEGSADKDDDEEIITSNEDEGYDDISSIELKKKSDDDAEDSSNRNSDDGMLD